jgi:hypothetical protein
VKTDLLQKRYVAWLLDGLIFFVPSVVALVLFVNDEAETARWIWLASWVVLVLLNHIVLEGLTGRTVGKLIMGLHTRRLEDPTRPPGIPRAALRRLLYPIDTIGPGVPLVAFVSMRMSNRQQRLGDRVARTLVGVPFPPRAQVGDRADTNGVWLDLPAPDGRSSSQVRSDANWRAAWYGDPEDPDRLRWFDGSEMTTQTRSRILTAEDIAALDA